MLDDENLRRFKNELAQLIGKHAVGLDESSISEVLEEYSETLNRPSRPGLQEDSLPFEEPTTDVNGLSENTSAAEERAAKIQALKDRRARRLPRPRRQEPLPEPGPSTSPSAPRCLSFDTPTSSAPVSEFDNLHLRTNEPQAHWDLGTTPLVEVLRQISTFDGAGLVRVQADRGSARLLCCNGAFHAIEILPYSETRSLLAFLAGRRRLDAHQIAQLREHARREQLPEIDILLQSNRIISPRTVTDAARERIRNLCLRLFASQLEAIAYWPLEELPASLDSIAVPILPLLFAHVRSHYGTAKSTEREAFESSATGMLLGRREDFGFNINALGLHIAERLLLDLDLAQVRSFETVLNQTPLPRNETVAIIAAMESVGLIEIKPPGLGEARSSSGTEILREAVQRLNAMERRLDQEDFFGVFGLHWTTYDNEIDRRYKEVSAHFHPLNQPLGYEERDRQRLKEVRQRLATLHKTLINPRERLRFRLANVPPADLLEAAMSLETLGETALKKRSFKRALDCYQRLLELDPNHPKASRILPTLLVQVSQS